MSVLGCAPASLHPTYDYCRLGLDGKGDGQIAATKRTSPRGTKRSPCWHSSSSLLAASGRLGAAASGRYHVVIFMKRNPTKCSRRFMSVLGCAPASLHPTYDYRRLGSDGEGDGQIAATKRASPRGTKRSPCRHISGSLLAASRRLGAAAPGRHHAVKFVKRNPTKCSRRGYVSIGLRSCVAAPNLRLLDTRFTGRLPRPLPVLPGLLAQSQQRGLATTNQQFRGDCQ